MNSFKCPQCGGNQYTSCDTAEGCIYCGHRELVKMDKLEPEESEGFAAVELKRSCENCGNLRCANSVVAYWWDECVDSNFEKHWMPQI